MPSGRGRFLGKRKASNSWAVTNRPVVEKPSLGEGWSICGVIPQGKRRSVGEVVFQEEGCPQGGVDSSEKEKNFREIEDQRLNENDDDDNVLSENESNDLIKV